MYELAPLHSLPANLFGVIMALVLPQMSLVPMNFKSLQKVLVNIAMMLCEAYTMTAAAARRVKQTLKHLVLQAQCLTAAGLNPKFLATKDEVLRLIGDRQDVLEGELRRRMGNNPDTSKALRCSCCPCNPSHLHHHTQKTRSSDKTMDWDGKLGRAHKLSDLRWFVFSGLCSLSSW